MKPKRRMHTAAHGGVGDGMDDSGHFADEGKDDGEDCRAADDPGAVYACHGHDAHIFTVSGIWRGTGKTGNHI